ncbi:Hypothetical protein LLA12_00155 [Lactococcus lactis subsp. lactis]|nr:Hypothetical protein LLA12_00155 [Lactococcus lactis subsp. lactis]
MIDKYGKMLAE